jgi:hypothetical protein
MSDVDKTEDKLNVTCSCCGAALLVDRQTGQVIWHEAKGKKAEQKTMKEMVDILEVQRRETAEKFERERQALKERGRILEEKVKESMKRVDKTEKPPLRPVDLD